jgi:hypothetical protein
VDAFCIDGMFIIGVDELPIADRNVVCLKPQSGINRVRIVNFPE